jgi:general secretion pathway protein J
MRLAEGARGQSGFTLIEVLIAITLMAIIVTVGFAVVRTGLRSWDASEARFQATEQRAAAIHFLRHYLADAWPEHGTGDAEGGEAAGFQFIGTTQSIQFIAPVPDHVGHGMMYRFILHADASALRIAMQPNGVPLLTPLLEPERTTLLEPVRLVRFAYFGSDRDKPGQSYWRPDWASPYFPELIGIHIEDSVGVLELQVAPRRGGGL